MKVVIWAEMDSDSRQLIRDKAVDVELHFANKHDMAEIDKIALEQAQVIFGNVAPESLPKLTQLEWLQLESVGFGGYGETVQPSQTITNLQGFGKHAVAETVLAGVLALYRRMDILIPAKADHDWQKDAIRASSKTLKGATVLILGYGQIGQYAGSLFEAFGCQVIAFSRQRTAKTHPLSELDSFLTQADIVIGCLPHTRETVGLLNADRIAKFKRDAILVNVGRGSLIEESALLQALNDGKLAGAVLDVTLEEPLPHNHPLWECPNTILTQHTGGGFDGELSGRAQVFLDNLACYQAGKPLLNIVNFERGY
ncbi:MAG: D-2-hydroxyacid dehydrogenase [Aggregatilineales bacterium]